MGETGTDTVGNDLTTSDAHVVQTDHATSDPCWGDLGNVQRNDHGGATDTETNDETANAHLCNAVRGSLEKSANGEENATEIMSASIFTKLYAWPAFGTTNPA